MNKKLRAILILVCLFICGCITQPYHPDIKPGEMPIKYKILEVPLFAQETRMWCWAASGEMIMHYYGEEVPQHTQANNWFNRSNCGTTTRSWKCIKGGWPQFTRYGLTCALPKYGPLSWQELVSQIQANQPVGFSWEWKTKGSHYMVARGYIILNHTRLVVVNDPMPTDSDKYKGGTVSIMTYDDYVQFSPSYKHSFTQYDITLTHDEKRKTPGKERRFISSGDMTATPVHLENKSITLPGAAAREGLELLKALPWPIQKELGFGSKTMVEKSKLGKKSFYTLGKGAGLWQDTREIPGDVLEVHYPVEVEKELVTSITTRKREGKWKFAVISDSGALSAVKALNGMIAPREEPSYFMVQIQSMNLSFLAYFLEQEQEEMEEDNTLLYLVPTHEDPDLKFPLYVPVPAAEVFLELKYLLEQMAEEKGGEALKNQFTGDWNKMDELLEDLDSREKTTAISAVQSLVEIINKVFTELENQNNDLAQQGLY
jgi:hypothetical protein